MELSAFSRCDLCEMWAPSECVKICMENACSGWCDNALLFITLPDSLLLCISSRSKCRLHVDCMWTNITMDSVHDSIMHRHCWFVLYLFLNWQCMMWGHQGQSEAAVDRDLWSTRVETEVVVAVGLGESHIDGLLIIPPYSCSKPTRPCGRALLLSQLVHSAQQSANKV